MSHNSDAIREFKDTQMTNNAKVIEDLKSIRNEVGRAYGKFLLAFVLIDYQFYHELFSINKKYQTEVIDKK